MQNKICKMNRTGATHIEQALDHPITAEPEVRSLFFFFFNVKNEYKAMVLTVAE
jgi:hypothetical protein